MAYTEVKSNAYNFSEVSESDKQVLVTNNLGRTALYGEFVYLDGYFGEVREYGGIASGSTGHININFERRVRTQQVEATDTFTKGNTLWFVSGGAGAAGTFQDADPGTGTRLACGIITDEEGIGGAQTAVEFRPFAQRLDASDVSAQVSTNTTAIGTLASLTTTEKTNLVGAINEVDANADANAADITTLQSQMLVEQAEPKTLVVEVESDYSGGVAVAGLSENDKVLGMRSNCNVTNTAGTIKLTDGADNDITDALQQATDKEVAYAATIDKTYSTLPATGAKLIAGGTDATLTRCTVVIEYIPAAI